MSTLTELDFAALVGSRICHDLISPIGAINNGMELLAMSGTGNSPEVALISQSVEAANVRIRFFRVAFGASNAGQAMGRPDTLSILRDMTRDTKLSINWEPVDDFQRSEIQLAFLGILCAEQALPYGGTINVTHAQNRWHLTLTADRFGLDPSLWNILTASERPEVKPAHVQFAMLPAFLENQGRCAEWTQNETTVTLSF